MDELAQIMAEIGYPWAYYQFAEGEAPTVPFTVYDLPNSNNFFADGVVYKPFEVVNIYLYTDKKDKISESLVETVLYNHGIAWQKSETYIPDERLYQVIYTFEKEM